MGTNDFLKAFVELIAVHQKNFPASQTFHFDVRAQAKDLEPLAVGEAGVAFFHFDFIVKGRI